jgi:hypothetical protein
MPSQQHFTQIRYIHLPPKSIRTLPPINPNKAPLAPTEIESGLSKALNTSELTPNYPLPHQSASNRTQKVNYQKFGNSPFFLNNQTKSQLSK